MSAFRLPASLRRRRRKASSALSLLVAASLGAAMLSATDEAVAVPPTDTLSVGSTLGSGQELVSGNAAYHLVMQTDGNLVQYGDGRPRWWTGTNGNPGAVLRFQGDGNVVLVSSSGRPLWATQTYGANAANRLVMRDDGNHVAYADSGRPVFQQPGATSSGGSFSSPDGKFNAAMQPDGNFVLTYRNSASADTLWSSGTGGRPGARLVSQTDGNLVIYDGVTPVWSAGSYGNPGARTVLQADGNLVVYSAGGRPLFSTATSNAAAGIQAPGDARFDRVWAHAFNDAGLPVGLGSPGVGTLDGGGAAAILGSRSGGVYAFHLSDGSAVPGWPVGTGGVAVDSTPSVIGSGAGAQVFVGLGTSARPEAGGLLAINANGAVRWNRTYKANPPGEPDESAGVQGSAAVGRLQAPAGQFDVITGSMRQMQYSFNSSTGATLQGFPWFQADSNFSTPALVDLYGRGSDVIIEGGDSTFGNAFWTQYQNGGHLRILNPTGNLGRPLPSDGLVCQYDTNQVMQSSPAVGRFLPGGALGIVAGSGTWYAGASDTNKLIAIDTGCHLAWKADLDGPTGASPSLIDVMGTGTNAIIQGTNRSATSGSVYAINGATGATLWRTPVAGGIYGSITSIDLGGGYQSLLVPTATGVFILDGRTGNQVSKLVDYVGVLNTALVTVDPDGAIGVTVAGYNGVNRSVAMHFRLRGSNVGSVAGRGQWPMFHANPRLTGQAND